ncbi:MAG: SemiSWEET transporter [Candidatus Omnitrophica bacterium]|nr:SemiSWEET transporter [Candidatus Omnitrophota bacterium]MBU1894760.1 SemiSWEET transporter [Candidatus Omnitrophota bacterium]
MQDLYMELIGLSAGICTTVSFIPQIVKIVKSKHARDISLWMYVILTMGIFLWLVYGILSSRISIILANGVSFLLCSFIITSKMKYRR